MDHCGVTMCCETVAPPPVFCYLDVIEGCHDYLVYVVLSEFVPIVGATVWDVGAYIGYHSGSMEKQCASNCGFCLWQWPIVSIPLAVLSS